MSIKIALNMFQEIIIFKAFPVMGAFLALIMGGGFLISLLLAAIVKVILYYFEPEIKRFAIWLRKKIKNE